MVHPTGTWRRLLAILAVLGLFLAACGDDADEASDDATETADDAEATDDTEAEVEEGDDAEADEGDDAEAAGGDLELTEVRVGLIPIADVATVFLAIENGYFEDEGLTVQTEFIQGGAAAIPAAVAGDMDIVFGAYPSFFTAIQEGLDLRIITEANRAAPDFAGLFSMPDSGIETPEDLAGTTIAVNTLNNVVQLAVEVQLQNAGLSLDDVTLVEIPFPDMVATLERGDVDVIATVQPFASIAQNSLEANTVVDMFSPPIDSFPVAGFYVTGEFAEANPNTVAAFNRAFAAAVDEVNSNDDAIPQVLPTYIESATVESARDLIYPEFVSGTDVEFLQTVPDFMVEQGLLEENIDVAEYVVG